MSKITFSCETLVKTGYLCRYNGLEMVLSILVIVILGLSREGEEGRFRWGE